MSENKLLERLFASESGRELGEIVKEIQVAMHTDPVDWQSDFDYVLERARDKNTKTYLAYCQARIELDELGVPVQTALSRIQRNEKPAMAIVEAKAKLYDAQREYMRANMVLKYVWGLIENIDIILADGRKPLPPIEFRIN